MSEMIPDILPEDPGERRIFELLRDDKNTKGWIVLHSLPLVYRGPGKPYGEIDFVVIIPGEGIICIEVKDGTIIREDNGRWSRYKNDKEKYRVKNPFAQAKDSTLALEKKIREEFGDSGESKCPIGRMVIFNEVRCPPRNTEFRRWEVIDCDDLSGNRLISSFIKKAIKEWRQILKKPVFLTPSEAKNIRNFLRRGSTVKKNRWIKKSEDELLRLTKNQYFVLDGLKKTSRWLIEGAAGTGKTVLAVESACRASREGKKVLLVCYNRLLAQSLETWTEKHSNITVGTFHKVLKDLIEKSSFKERFISERKSPEAEEFYDKMDRDKIYYDKTYIEYGQLALDKEEIGPQFDLIVMDEGQDLIFRNGVLDVINAALHGGLSNGSWLIFGDFTRQNIYNTNGKSDTSDKSVASVLKSCGEGLDFSGPYELPVNCRNTKRIAEATYRLSEFDGPPCMDGKEDGLEVEYKYWNGYDHLAELLGGRINGLLQEDISLEDIVILFPARLKDRLEIPGFSLEDFPGNLHSGKRRKVVKCSSIKSFKGLESTAIILVVGMEEMFGDNSQSLFYVAMSRARSLLVVMMDQRGKRQIQKSHPELIA